MPCRSSDETLHAGNGVSNGIFNNRGHGVTKRLQCCTDRGPCCCGANKRGAGRMKPMLLPRYRSGGGDEAMKITKLVPWLVKAAGTYWGEYFFVEVRTDEGVTGWGEITTTTRIANRAVAGIIRQLNELLVGEDPSQIERLWHKTFRSFTYTGSRGATTQRGQRHRHRAMGYPRQGAGPADLRPARRQGARRHPALHPPGQPQFRHRRRRGEGDPRHRRLRPHRAEVRSVPASRTASAPRTTAISTAA